MSDIVKSDTSSGKEQTKLYAPAKRFVFEVPDEVSQSEGRSSDSLKTNKVVLLQKFLPMTFGFIPPHNFKEAYENICEAVLATYSEIRDLPFLDCLEGIEALKESKMEGPIDCIRILRKIVMMLFGKLKEFCPKGKTQYAANEYEKLLQQAELKVRDLIRNEQIYRLNFDQLVMKSDEAERCAAELKELLKEKQTKIDNLTNETAKLTSALRHKDREIRSLLIERHAIQQNQADAPGSYAESPISSEHHKGKTLSCNSQNIQLLLNDARLTPPNLPNKMLNNLKKSSNNRTPTSMKSMKGKVLPKSGTVIDLMTINPKDLKLNGFDKLRDIREAIKGQVGALTERRKNGSGTPGLNQSGRLLEGLSFFASARGISTQNQQIMDTPNQTRSKGAWKENEKSHSPMPLRARQQEEVVQSMIKGESFEDGLRSVQGDKKRMGDLERKTPVRVESSHVTASKHVRRSGAARTRPQAADTTLSSQKSLEQKSNLSSVRQGGTANNSQRSVLKSKSIVVESKPTKGARSNSPFVNIMMKKFADQENHMKKNF